MFIVNLIYLLLICSYLFISSYLRDSDVKKGKDVKLRLIIQKAGFWLLIKF